MDISIIIFLGILSILWVGVIVLYMRYRIKTQSRDLDMKEIKDRIDKDTKLEIAKDIFRRYDESLERLAEDDMQIANPLSGRRKRGSSILGYTGEDDRIHTKNPEGKNILIPEHLTEVEKEVLKEFYNL